jgi:hypothetical protein
VFCALISIGWGKAWIPASAGMTKSLAISGVSPTKEPFFITLLKDSKLLNRMKVLLKSILQGLHFASIFDVAYKVAPEAGQALSRTLQGESRIFLVISS